MRGPDAAVIPRARMDVELRRSEYVRDPQADPRLLDPTLERAFALVAEDVRTTAYAEGFTQGYAEGRDRAAQEAAAIEQARDEAVAQAQAAMAERLYSVLTALAAAASQVEQQWIPAYDQAAAELGPTAVTLVEALLGHELSTPVEQVLDAVRRIASVASMNAPLVLRLNPADADTLWECGVELPEVLGRPVEITPDPAVECGGAVGESGASRIDAQLSTALARLREVLAA